MYIYIYVLIYIIQIIYMYIYIYVYTYIFIYIRDQKNVLCPRFVGNHRQHCWWTSNSRLQRLPPSPIEVVPPGIHCWWWNLRLAGWLIADNPSEEVPDKWELVPSTSGNNTLTTRLPIINWDGPSATDVAKPAGVFQQTLRYSQMDSCVIPISLPALGSYK